MKITNIIKIKALLISIIITNTFAITIKNSNNKIIVYASFYLTLIFFRFLIFLFILKIILKKANSESLKKLEKSEVIESVSYALANELKTDDFYVQNSKDFKSVQYVNTLPPRKPISDGVVETIEEVKTISNFFVIKKT